MGGLVSEAGTLFGGSAAKTDRKNQLAGFGDLSNLFNFGFSSGTSETNQSQGLLGQAGGYYSSLLNGNRSATLGAVAPTVNAANATTDAAKRGIATSGTARGGGVNATGQTLDDSKRANIDTAVNSAKAGAAGGATAVGGTMASQASNLLGMGETSASNLTSLAGSSRSESNALRQQKVTATADMTNTVIDAIASLFGAGGGGAGAGGAAGGGGGM
jgi:hypothetical protein